MTLTLPSDSLQQVERIAPDRRAKPSAIVSATRGEQIVDSYRQAFAGFTDEEMMILDGVVLEAADRGSAADSQ